MNLFNTLKHGIDELLPIDGGVVRIYSCGPTVYNHAHIGNLSAYIFADILRRTINLAGYSTEHVMNFTDIDDKTIRDSRAKYPDLPPMEALQKLTKHYEKIFISEMAQIGNNNEAIKFVRATESIVDMQILIRKLLGEGIAYIADDGIYFSIAEYKKTRTYGQLSQVEITSDTRSRIDNDEYDKESAQDFALWKKEKDGEPAWDFEIDSPEPKKLKFFIIHGTEGHPDENWFPWLKKHLEELGHEVIIPQFPSPPIVAAKISEWFDVWEKYKDEIDENTVIVGHSLGGMFTLRLLEIMKNPIHAAVFTAAPIGIKPIKFYDRDLAFKGDFNFDWDKIRENARNFVVYHSDNDPYVDIANGRELAKQLGIEMTFVPSAGHFSKKTSNYVEFPRLLDDIKIKILKQVQDDKIDRLNLRGRPGWHIECSAMSAKTLSQPFDIHTGGVDLIFPHHENEIAQSTAGSQPEKYANFFVHNEHLLVDGKKMSKSAHNFYTLPDILKAGFDALDFRMLVLQSHYRSATNFSWDNLTAAQNRRRNWRNIAELRWQTSDSGDDGQAQIINNLLDTATVAFMNDVDTPNVLKHLDQIVDLFINNIDNISHFGLTNFINFVDDNLGLNLENTTPDITDEQYKLVKSREEARAQKDWAKSDKIRDKLLGQGIGIRDTNMGQIWSRM